MAERIFVYGTLRGSEGTTSLLSGAHRLGESTVNGMLYDLGAYPAVVLGGEARVHGEVWECPPETLRALDSYEGVAEGLFRRERVETEGAGEAWIYVAGPALESRLASARAVPGGVWRG